MTMPSDADAAVESHGSNDGPRDNPAAGNSTADNNTTHVDDENVPHPPGDDS